MPGSGAGAPGIAGIRTGAETRPGAETVAGAGTRTGAGAGAPAQGSLLARRQLGRQLRVLRKAAGKSLADVEATGIGSLSKLYRMEHGQVAIRTGDVRDLCVLYNAPDSILNRLLALAKASKTGGWQEDYVDVLHPGVGLYVDLEATAATLQTYNAEVVHGLLQTSGYTRRLIDEDEVQQSQLERLLQARRTRRRLAFERETPLRVTQILGEAALTRVIGSPEVMAAQLAHLRELNRREHVELRVLPWETGWHRALDSGAFTILSFAETADPDFVYLESLTGARYLEQRSQLRAYRQLWDRLTQQSIPLEEHLR